MYAIKKTKNIIGEYFINAFEMSDKPMNFDQKQIDEFNQLMKAAGVNKLKCSKLMAATIKTHFNTFLMCVKTNFELI